MKEKLPYAYSTGNEKDWQLDEVKFYYPEIVDYYELNGHIVTIIPCGPVDEDCLYVDGKWKSYCRHVFEWKRFDDLTEEEKPKAGK